VPAAAATGAALLPIEVGAGQADAVTRGSCGRPRSRSGSTRRRSSRPSWPPSCTTSATLRSRRDLFKPGRLDDEEFAFIKRHTIIGERILSGAPSLSAVARVVRSTHERVDGTGYPDGLAGDAIPLPARISSSATRSMP